MASILEQIPGYGGYIAKRQMNEQQSMSDLLNMAKVQDMLAQRQAMERGNRMASLEELKFQRESADFNQKQQRLGAAAEAIKTFSPRAQQVYALTGDPNKAFEAEQQERFMQSVPGLLGSSEPAPRPLQGKVFGNFKIDSPEQANQLVNDLSALEKSNPAEAAAVRESLVQQGLIQPPTVRTEANPDAIGRAGVMGALSGIKGADKLIEYAKLVQPSIGTIDTGGAIIRQNTKSGAVVGDPIPKSMTPDQKASNARDDARAAYEFNYQSGQPAPFSASSQSGSGLAPKAEQDLRVKGMSAFADNWIKNSYQPVQDKAQSADQILSQVQTLRNIDLKTGWGTEAIASAANILASLGNMSPEAAKKLATNAQVFQQVANERLWTVLNDAKGPQTEGDAERAKATWMQLRNTPQANAFIMDMMEAKAKRDKLKAEFYNDGYQIAAQDGNFARIDKEWRKIQRSIWDDPQMAKWKPAGGKK